MSNEHLGPLGDSPSDDFCSQDCSTAWSAARAEPLAGCQEPADLPAHGLTAARRGGCYFQVVRDEWTEAGDRIIRELRVLSFAPSSDPRRTR